MDKIRVGVLGVGRGKSFMDPLLRDIGYELIAVCDINEEALLNIKKKYSGVEIFTDYESFLNADFDVVVLANFFHQHAPYAVKALNAGKHVISETIPAGTMGELCQLVKAARQSNKIYMLAENYPYIAVCKEMRRLYAEGEIGEIMYAEGEYNHPFTAKEWCNLTPFDGHWRSRLPSTYYSTHAMAPLMRVTGRMPVSVTAQSISAGRDEVLRNSPCKQDPGAVMICKMDNGAVFRIFGLTVPGHSIWYRFHGSKGAMESERGTGYELPGSYWGSGKVRVWHEPESLTPGQTRERIYFAEVSEFKEQADRAGHGGSDFFVMLDFARTLRGEISNPCGILPAAAMTAVAIFGWKSCLEGGKTYEIPDFNDDKALLPYENDFLSPFVEGQNEIPCSTIPPRIITPQEQEFMESCWNENTNC